MDKKQLISMIKKFCEDPDSVLVQGNTIVFQTVSTACSIQLSQNTDGDLRIIDSEISYNPINWIARRLSRLDLLASRIADIPFDDSVFVETPGRLSSNDDEGLINSPEQIISFINEPSKYETEILYLTSNAGEGKSTLINYCARKIAGNFKAGKTQRLLVPIPLGGRVSLRFDDTIMGVMINNYRFHGMFYDSFVELVKLGVIVPALDGFEEMFIDGEGGEGATSIGKLVNSLESSGRILIAARKAFFESKNLSTQAKLFGSINSDYDASFERIELQKWTSNERKIYSSKRGIDNYEEFVTHVEHFFSDANHPLLTRPVLFKKIIDVYADSDSYDVLNALGSTVNYFPAFMRSIIEREAVSKWFDRTGEIIHPLLTVDQHLELLSMIASEMWSANQSGLSKQEVELVTELFSERIGLNGSVRRQVKERIFDHPLLEYSESIAQIKFEHDEFYDYFVGFAFFKSYQTQEKYEALLLSRPRYFTDKIVETISVLMSEHKQELGFEFLVSLISGEPYSSYPRENISAILLRMQSYSNSDRNISGLSCTREITLTCRIENATIEKSHFWSISNENFHNCTFNGVRIETLIAQTCAQIRHNRYIDCDIAALYIASSDEYIYEPGVIAGFIADTQNHFDDEDNSVRNPEPDEKFKILENVLRKFERQTFFNEGVLMEKIGAKYSLFADEILPDLLKAEVLSEIPYRGGGVQRRFKFTGSRTRITAARTEARGCYDKFIELVLR